MKKYRLLYILKGTLNVDEKNAEVAKLNKLLEDFGAKVTKTDESLGLRTLAYPIKDQTKGYYVDLIVEMDDMKAKNEFDRLSKINSNVIRYNFTVEK